MSKPIFIVMGMDGTEKWPTGVFASRTKADAHAAQLTTLRAKRGEGNYSYFVIRDTLYENHEA